MKKTLLFILAFASSTIGFSQYCNLGGPSNTNDSNIESLSLVGSSGAISYTGCPGLSGVVEYLGQTAFIDAGGNYTTNIEFGTCGGNYSGVGKHGLTSIKISFSRLRNRLVPGLVYLLYQ